MKLSEICIKRPVFSWVLTFLITVVGIVAFTRLPLQQFPTIAEPYITIEANYQGAGPEIMESQVTRKIEEHMAGIEGLDYMQSTSKDAKSEVTLAFNAGADINLATNEVRDRLTRVYQDASWPKEMLPPTLRKTRADDRPIMQIAMISDDVPLEDLYDYADNEIKKNFEAVSGVGNVEISGSGLYIMRIYVDPTKLAQFKVTTDEVLNAIRQQNFEKPIGKLSSQTREFLVTATLMLEKPEEFDNIIISSKNNNLVRLKDIGYSKLETNNRDTKTHLNGKPGIRISIFKQSTANPMEISRDVRKELKLVEEQMPKDRSAFVLSDQSEYIERSIKEVYRTIVESSILVVLVVFLFLQSFRASIIPLVTIPVSLIGTFAVMQLFGYTINTMTLMAIVLAIGLVVDDAIVVLENIYRYVEKGMEPFEAAYKGIKEIAFPVIAMTLTLAAVYAPVSFAKGQTGKFLGEFSITLAVSVIISGFVALTLSPMMCARLLKSHKDEASTDSLWVKKIRQNIPIEKWLNNIDIFYEKKLKLALNKRIVVIMSGLVFALVGVGEWFFLPQMKSPNEDKAYVAVRGHAPYSSTLQFTDKYVRKIDAIVAAIPEVSQRSSSITNPSFDVIMNLKPDSKRSSEDIKNYLSKELSDVAGVYIESISTGFEAGAGSTRVEVLIKTNKDLKELFSTAQSVASWFRSEPLFTGNIQWTLKEDRLDYAVKINRDKAMTLKIDPRAIAETVETLVRGQKANMFKRDNRLYDVRVEVEDQDRRKKEDILRLLIRAGAGVKEGTLLPLAELITIENRPGVPEIMRYNRQRSAILYVEMSKGSSLMDGVERIKTILNENLGADTSYDFAGETRKFMKERDIMTFIFSLSLVFIYLVLAAQFESWRDPFIIMLSVPLSLAGAIITLVLIKDGSINMYSNIGLITLVGLITKHGILMVQFANELQAEEGMNVKDAILKACVIRLRPILMTTAAMVLGALPLALATGPGSETRRQIGWVIVGGMSMGTVFTLFVLPAIYSIMGVYKPKRGVNAV
ncbi:MAG: multidrug transporter AcrB [Alphaproteobacteria bacterium CG_4_10_14_0_8_um_filter_37_21]|nr:MAG: multidrug transporter AcrB [Alphaproteobacteria bacterium CG_4_10_14_0_8_um_filter_37_21]